MDEAAQKDLKVRFIKLVVLLNAFMILVAAAILLFVWVPTPAGRVIAVLCIAAAAAILLYITRLYRQTKLWLDNEHRKGTMQPPGTDGEGTGAGGEHTG
ncbi:MAG: hypothetical protein LUQ64_01870 [Methanomicrobiales archaeon]|nr:hypothetical protein [Methanomicrobiales archaeon]